MLNYIQQFLLILTVCYKWSIGQDNKADAVATAKPLLAKLHIPQWILNIPIVIDALLGKLVTVVEMELLKLEGNNPVTRGIFGVGYQIALIVEGAINLVEGTGTGPEKRAAAIAEVEGLLALLPLPIWIKALLTSDVIGALIDLAVECCNNRGIFNHAPTPPPPATLEQPIAESQPVQAEPVALATV